MEDNLKKTKLIAFDLDGTLLSADGTLVKENLLAIRKAHQAGIQLAVATGRPFFALPKEVLAIPEMSYAIVSNGASVYTLPEGKNLRTKRLRPASVRQILKETKEIFAAFYDERKDLPAVCEVFRNGRTYTTDRYIKNPGAFGIRPAYHSYIKKTRQGVPDLFSFIQKHEKELEGIDFIFRDRELLESVREKLAEGVSGIRLTASGSNRIEISSEAAGKEEALNFLMKRRRQTLSNAAAFGDADNDAGMLKAAGIGIAMGHATENARKAADRIVAEKSIQGVAEEIQYLIDRNYMLEALKESQKAEAADEVPIGAVIVQDGKVIARGYNRRNRDADTSSHAEMNAIRRASGRLGDWRLEGCTLYVTLEPCPMCAGALVQARADRVVFGSYNPKAGCCGSLLDLVRYPKFNHQLDVTGGVLEEECSRRLRAFFARLRKQKAGQKVSRGASPRS